MRWKKGEGGPWLLSTVSESREYFGGSLRFVSRWCLVALGYEVLASATWKSYIVSFWFNYCQTCQNSTTKTWVDSWRLCRFLYLFYLVVWYLLNIFHQFVSARPSISVIVPTGLYNRPQSNWHLLPWASSWAWCQWLYNIANCLLNHLIRHIREWLIPCIDLLYTMIRNPQWWPFVKLDCLPLCKHTQRHTHH